jgi:hypothetical protein
MSATTESLTGDEVSWLDLQTDTVPWPEAVGQ